MSEFNITNKLLAQMAFAFLLLASFASKHLNCEALALKPNKGNSLPNRVTYQNPKVVINQAIPERVDPKSGPAVAPSILSDYYNTLLTSQNLRRLPAQSWPQQELAYIPFPNVGNDNEYDNGDEYYGDDNSEALRSAANNIANMYGNDVYQPEGWFNGPVVLDNPETNAENDDTNDPQLNTLMMAYLLDQFDKLNQLKSLSEKRGPEFKSEYQEKEVTTTLPSVTTSGPSPTKVTTNAIPKKLTAKQFRLVQRGQKEFPLLRPAADNDEKPADMSNSNWPSELEESNLSQEDSLQSLRGQTRTVRDVLTAQLDSLKKEGPKMH